MATITYLDLDGACPSTTFRGIAFVSGETLETDDQALVEAVRGNPYFDVGESLTVQVDEFGAYAVRHLGRGRYGVLKGHDKVADGLSKDQAEAKARELASADAAAAQQQAA